jgi:alkylation response protein AidB-like acyl-CoA dehydrogenase
MVLIAAQKGDRLKSFLQTVHIYCQNEIAPQANELDRSPEAIRKALLGLGERQWLALRLPTKSGGMDLDTISFWQFQIILARHSGALCFLQAQHQGAATQIFKTQNQTLREEYFPHLARGKKLLGVGFSQLRRQGEPIVKAFPIDGGYRISGVIPWVTGAGIFEEFILGATLPTGEALYGIAPLKTIDCSENGRMLASEPLFLAAAQATQTVSLTLDNWFLEAAKIVSLQPPEAIHLQDRQNVLNHSTFALGCAWAGLDIVAFIMKKKPLLSIQKTWQLLQTQLNNLQEKILTDSEATYEQKLQWRSQAIILANRCAHAAVIVASGEANLMSHPAQRIYREALLFSISGQTTDVLEATLSSLTD